MELRGAAAIVTGGATGFGAATARRLAALGARVVIADVADQRGTALAAELDGAYAHTDVTSTLDVQEAIAAARALGPLRALVTCAAMGWSAPTVGPGATPAALEDFLTVVRVNLVGTYDCVRLAAAAMARNEPVAGGGRGAIVTTSSTAVFDGHAGQAAYAAAKGAIAAMTRPIAHDLQELDIRINAIAAAPGASGLRAIIPPAPADDMAIGREPAPPPIPPDRFAALAVELLTDPRRSGETVRLDAGSAAPA